MESVHGKAQFKLLHSLIKKQNWQLESIKRELACASAVVSRLRADVERMGTAITDQLKALTHCQRAGQTLDPEKVQRIVRFLDQLTKQKDDKQKEWKQAEKIVTQLREEYERELNRGRILDEMLEKRQLNWQQEQLRTLAAELDDLWLQREHGA